jgi:uncharacterized protein with HEPN domain
LPPDPRTYLWDARDAGDAIVQFTRGKTFADFAGDRLLRSAVERQFEIVGEALARLAKIDPALARRIPDLSRIVAFRNILVHGYTMVDRALVWRVGEEHLPDLRATLDGLLRADNPSAG